MATEIDLKNITESGSVPTERLQDAPKALEIGRSMRDAYRQGPGRADNRIRQCLDGNPPIDPQKLAEANRAWESNVNFRLLESDITFSRVPYYSLFSEVPVYAQPKVDTGRNMDDIAYGDTMASAHKATMDKWENFKIQFQLSVDNRVTYGLGPLYFPDKDDPRFKSARRKELLFPQDTPIDSDEWEIVGLMHPYTVTGLFRKIQNEKLAADAGWNVAAVKTAISEACNTSVEGDGYDYAYWQQRIRANDAFFSTSIKKVETIRLFVAEFSGKISSYILNLNGTGEYLYRSHECYESWSQIIQLFNAEVGDGYVGGIKGVGTKAFPFRDIQNRLKNDCVTAARVGSQVFLKPATPDAEDALDVIVMGPWARLPYGVDISQAPLGSNLDKPLAVDRQMEQDLARNIGAYRKNPTDNAGRNVTATEAEINYGQEQTISAQQHDLFVGQLDKLYEEQFKRLCAPLRTETEEEPYTKAEKMIKFFQDYCTDRGVPKEAFKKVISVKAFRTIGQGSKFFRNQLFEKILGIYPLLPPAVQERHTRNYISALTDNEYLETIWPKEEATANAVLDDESKAQDENASMVVGVMPLITPSQNNLAHAKVHLQFWAQALQAAGQDPMKFILMAQVMDSHVRQTLEAAAKDASTGSSYKSINDSRNKELKGLWSAYQQLQAASRKIIQQVQQAQQAQAQAQAEQQAQQAQAAAVPEQTQKLLEAAKTQAEIDQIRSDIAMDAAEEQRKRAELDLKMAESLKPEPATTPKQ